MESKVAAKEERAEVAARTAADELSEANKERRGLESKIVHPPEYCRETDVRQEEKSPGVIGNIIRTVQGTVGHAKDAVVGKAHDTADKAAEYKGYTADKAKQAKDATTGKLGEYRDYSAEKTKETGDAAAEKAKETKDYAADKAAQAKDATVEKAGEYKDYAADKATQAKDYTAEKAKEGKDTTVGKITEVKDSAACAARRAVDYLTGKKEEAKQVAQETGEATKEKAVETKEAAKEKYDENKEEARREMEEMKIEGEREGDKAETGGGGGIFGVLGGVKDAIKGTLAPQAAEETAEKGTTEVSYGGEGEAKAGMRLGVDKEGTPVVMKRVEDTPSSATAFRLKQADQLTGQTFNDVG